MPMGLHALEKALQQDLAWINIPPKPWTVASSDLCDVVIIGAGMAGMTVAFALKKRGITNIRMFDEAPHGKEGPWDTYARMKILRSPKDLMGPSLHIPNLTFQAWYIAQYGQEPWDLLGKIPTSLWMDYLKWYRKVLHLPIENETALLSIAQDENVLRLTIQKEGKTHFVHTRKLILATGRSGFGGLHIPSFAKHLSKSSYAHTSEAIDFQKLSGKKILIVGGGASAFDAAAVALETNAASVDILIRHEKLTNKNIACSLAYPGLNCGFHKLDDATRWKFLQHAYQRCAPPPVEALQRLQGHDNILVHPNQIIEQVTHRDNVLSIKTQKQMFSADFLILGTGFAIDGSLRKELRDIFPQILLWKDRPHLDHAIKHLGAFPYLGPHMEFLEKTPGCAPYLKNIHCYNFGANCSHGPITGDIPGISVGAERVAEGITADLFASCIADYYARLQGYNKVDFNHEDFSFLL